MSGRYGFDILSKILLLIGCILSLWKFTLPFGIIFFVISFYRALSKDIVSRKNECIRFEKWLNKTFKNNNQSNYGGQGFLSKLKYEFYRYKYRIANYINEKKNYKIVKCPKCGQKLRLPRGKGKIIVTCKKCSYEFKMKT
ncbi:hypothetical protein [Clostridium fallax]|uniref:Zn-finger containing protein n=1 Tax=Clostridium fallax TaxID=1533 RepID=A0A1M4T9Y1_9CLOT|nr:hypothetical protein [Clostridium fallax]SHE41271.1 hypothetical protein SAMN05443638_10290 [Clostridium fallax]SQB22668.1 zinc finger containing protein [Clostridium fallax]